MRVNGEGAGAVARAAARRGLPLLHLSTDYVFDGSLDRPWREGRPDRPDRGLWRSKLAGEQAVLRENRGATILRPPGLAPVRRQFRQDMLRPRRDAGRSPGGRGPARARRPRRLTCADALLADRAQTAGRTATRHCQAFSICRVAAKRLGRFRRRDFCCRRGIWRSRPRRPHRDRRLSHRPRAGRQFAASTIPGSPASMGVALPTGACPPARCRRAAFGKIPHCN